MSNYDRTDLERTEELFRFLQGQIPKGYKIPEAEIPHLDAEQAFTVIWYLGNQYWQVTDHVERCGSCSTLYDSNESGQWSSYVGGRCDGCRDELFKCCMCDARDDQRAWLVVVDAEKAGVPTGLYLTTDPYYTGIIEGHLINSALERLGDVPEGVDTEDYPAGHLCRGCAEKTLGERYAGLLARSAEAEAPS